MISSEVPYESIDAALEGFGRRGEAGNEAGRNPRSGEDEVRSGLSSSTLVSSPPIDFSTPRLSTGSSPRVTSTRWTPRMSLVTLQVGGERTRGAVAGIRPKPVRWGSTTRPPGSCSASAIATSTAPCSAFAQFASPSARNEDHRRLMGIVLIRTESLSIEANGNHGSKQDRWKALEDVSTGRQMESPSPRPGGGRRAISFFMKNEICTDPSACLI